MLIDYRKPENSTANFGKNSTRTHSEKGRQIAILPKRPCRQAATCLSLSVKAIHTDNAKHQVTQGCEEKFCSFLFD